MNPRLKQLLDEAAGRTLTDEEAQSILTAVNATTAERQEALLSVIEEYAAGGTLSEQEQAVFDALSAQVNRLGEEDKTPRNERLRRQFEQVLEQQGITPAGEEPDIETQDYLDDLFYQFATAFNRSAEEEQDFAAYVTPRLQQKVDQDTRQLVFLNEAKRVGLITEQSTLAEMQKVSKAFATAEQEMAIKRQMMTPEERDQAYREGVEQFRRTNPDPPDDNFTPTGRNDALPPLSREQFETRQTLARALELASTQKKVTAAQGKVTTEQRAQATARQRQLKAKPTRTAAEQEEMLQLESGLAQTAPEAGPSPEEQVRSTELTRQAQERERSTNPAGVSGKATDIAAQARARIAQLEEKRRLVGLTPEEEQDILDNRAVVDAAASGKLKDVPGIGGGGGAAASSPSVGSGRASTAGGSSMSAFERFILGEAARAPSIPTTPEQEDESAFLSFFADQEPVLTERFRQKNEQRVKAEQEFFNDPTPVFAERPDGTRVQLQKTMTNIGDPADSFERFIEQEAASLRNQFMTERKKRRAPQSPGISTVRYA